MQKTRRYIIEVTGAKTRKIAVFTGAEWTDDERRIIVAQMMRLAGLPDENWLTRPAEPGAKRGEG
jgi:hypothetical protein